MGNKGKARLVITTIIITIIIIIIIIIITTTAKRTSPITNKCIGIRVGKEIIMMEEGVIIADSAAVVDYIAIKSWVMERVIN